MLKALGSKTVKDIFSNTAFQLIGKAVSLFITVGATMIITRTYGREGYGEFNLMQNFPGLFFIITDFGLNAIATRELSADWSKAKQYLGNILAIRTLLSVVLMIIGGIVLYYLPYSDSLRFGIQLGLLVILTQSLFSAANIIFQVKLRYDLSTVGYIAGSILVLILVLIFSFFKVSISMVNFSYVLGGILTFVINLYFIKQLGVELSFTFDPKLVRYLFLQAFPLGLMFVFSQINFKADSIMLSVMKLPNKLGLSNTETVAVYGLPYKIFEVLLVVPTFFMNSTYPILVKHMQESKTRLLFTFTRSLGVLFGLGVLTGLAGYIFAPLIINILGGAQFDASVVVLRILTGGLFIFFLSQPISWLIVTLGYQKYLPLVYLVGAVFNVGLNYLLIPVYSFYASSLITLASELLILVMLISCVLIAWSNKFGKDA